MTAVIDRLAAEASWPEDDLAKIQRVAFSTVQNKILPLVKSVARMDIPLSISELRSLDSLNSSLIGYSVLEAAIERVAAEAHAERIRMVERAIAEQKFLASFANRSMAQKRRQERARLRRMA